MAFENKIKNALNCQEFWYCWWGKYSVIIWNKHLSIAVTIFSQWMSNSKTFHIHCNHISHIRKKNCSLFFNYLWKDYSVHFDIDTISISALPENKYFPKKQYETLSRIQIDFIRVFFSWFRMKEMIQSFKASTNENW